jgi:hypothetical protein
MKKNFRTFGLIIVKLLGSVIRDHEDQSILGRALIVSFRGRIHIFGYQGVPLRPVCVAQDGVKYWRICIGFTKAATPDYPNIVDNN